MVLKQVYVLLGCTSLVLGFLGIFLPVLPTTPFVLLSAYCFSRGSARMHGWLLSHSLFGPVVRDWQQGGIIRPKAKVASIVLMWGLIGYVVLSQEISSIVKALLLFTTAGVSLFILLRPSRMSERQADR